MLIRTLICFLLITLLSIPQVYAQEAPSSPEIVAAVKPFVDRNELAGAVLVVANKDKVLSVDTVGFADISAKKAMAKDAMFWIASQSKPITGAAFMILVDEGKVKLDDPVKKYLPEFENVWVAVEQDKEHILLKRPKNIMTIRHLLSHTSGLNFKSDIETPTLDAWPLKLTVRSYTMMPLHSEPGTKYVYSNAGINAAGRIIEVVSGMSYEEFMQKRLFAPLGMKDTVIRLNADQINRLALSYKPNAKKDGLESLPISQIRYPLDHAERQPFPGGGYFSTASDITKFCQCILNRGKVGDKQVISELSVDELIKKQTAESITQNYGLGWQLGADTAGHGGAYATNMSINKKLGLVTVYMIQHAGFPGEGGKAGGAFKKVAEDKFGNVKK